MADCCLSRRAAIVADVGDRQKSAKKRLFKRRSAHDQLNLITPNRETPAQMHHKPWPEKKRGRSVEGPPVGRP